MTMLEGQTVTGLKRCMPCTNLSHLEETAQNSLTLNKFSGFRHRHRDSRRWRKSTICHTSYRAIDNIAAYPIRQGPATTALEASTSNLGFPTAFNLETDVHFVLPLDPICPISSPSKLHDTTTNTCIYDHKEYHSSTTSPLKHSYCKSPFARAGGEVTRDMPVTRIAYSA